MNISVVVVNFSGTCLNEHGIIMELVFEVIRVDTISTFRKMTDQTADGHGRDYTAHLNLSDPHNISRHTVARLW